MCVHKNIENVIKSASNIRFFEFWAQHLYFYAKFQSAGPIPTPELVIIWRTKALRPLTSSSTLEVNINEMNTFWSRIHGFHVPNPWIFMKNAIFDQL